MMARLRGKPLEYVFNQRGEFYDLRNDPNAWVTAYHEEMQKTLDQLQLMFGKQKPRHVLDIGSGVGFIDLLLIKSWSCHCTLVDGEDGNGVADNHAKPFNSRAVSEEFMRDNQIHDTHWRYVNPDEFKTRPGTFPVFDLVLSLRSWGFHYPPSEYIMAVGQHVAPGSLIVMDMRIDKMDWHLAMEARWPDWYQIDTGQKFIRMCYRVGGRKQ